MDAPEEALEVGHGRHSAPHVRAGVRLRGELSHGARASFYFIDVKKRCAEPRVQLAFAFTD
jgi:hypothetical protein